MKTILAAGCALAMIAGATQAAVTDRSGAGFEVSETATIAATPSKIWFELVRPAHWWSSTHTFSGDAANLAMDPSGCFCEALKHGSVRHMTIVYAEQDKGLRLEGGIGPLQTTGATGHLAISLKPVTGGTEVAMTYDVGGYAKGGLAETWAAPVDRVLGEQLARLKKKVETGKPD